MQKKWPASEPTGSIHINSNPKKSSNDNTEIISLTSLYVSNMKKYAARVFFLAVFRRPIADEKKRRPKI